MVNPHGCGCVDLNKDYSEVRSIIERINIIFQSCHVATQTAIIWSVLQSLGYLHAVSTCTLDNRIVESACNVMSAVIMFYLRFGHHGSLKLDQLNSVVIMWHLH